jgi:hypothetical protein
LPKWAHDYHFHEVSDLAARRDKQAEEISEIDSRLRQFERYKRILTLRDEPLVDAVMEVFDDALPLKPKREEAFREDFMLHDAAGNRVALVEVKGVSKGVAREHINQAETHRERNGQPFEFPSLLTVNTNMKNATSLADREQKIASEQIEHSEEQCFDIENLGPTKPRGNAHGKSTGVREGGRIAHHLVGLSCPAEIPTDLSPPAISFS